MQTVECWNNEKVRIKSSTKFMEQLNVTRTQKTSVLSLKITEMQTVADDINGQLLAVTTESHEVWLYRLSEGKDTYECINTGLQGHQMAAGIGADNRLRLYAIKNDRLMYVEEKAPLSNLFTQQRELQITKPIEDCILDSLKVYPLQNEKGSSYALAVIMKSDKKYWINLRFQMEGSKEELLPVPVQSKHFSFTGTDRASFKMHIVGKNYSIYSVAKREVEQSYSINWVEPSQSEQIIQMEYTGQSVLLMLKNDLKTQVTVLEEQAQQGKMELTKLYEFEKCGKFQAVEEQNGNLCLTFESGRLLHSDAVKNGVKSGIPNGKWVSDSLSPLDDSASLLCMQRRKEVTSLFYFTGSEQTLHRLEDMGEKEWRETIYDKPEPGTVNRAACYSTELTFLDPVHNVPLPDMNIELHAESSTYLETLEGVSFVDQNRKTITKTDAFGRVYFRQYCSSLDVPVVYANVQDDLLGVDKEISFSQYAGVYSQLEQLDTDKILNANKMDSKTSRTEPLLSEKYHNRETAEQLAKGLSQLTKNFQGAKQGVMQVHNKNRRMELTALTNASLPPFRMAFLPDGQVVYEELTKEEAVFRCIQLQKGEGDVTLPRWMTAIGNFFRSVIKKIAHVFEVIFDGLKAVVKLVLDGIEMIFEAILTVVKEVLHFVEVIFSPLLIFFREIFRWLASLFGWDYVLYTKYAISGMIDMALEWVAKNAVEMGEFANQQMKKAEQSLDVLLDKAIQTIAPDQGLGTYLEQKTPSLDEHVEYAVSNDPLEAKLKEGDLFVKGLKPAEITFMHEVSGSLDDFMALLKACLEEMEHDPSFQKALDYMEKAFEDISHFFDCVLAALLSALKGLMHLIMNTAGKIVSAAGKLAAELIQMIRRVLHTKIDLPLISEIYSWLSDEELTLLDASSLCCALPATLIHKAAEGKVPFETKQKAEEFLQLLKRQQNVTVWRDGKLVCADAENIPVYAQKIVGGIMTAGALANGICNAVLDAQPAGGASVEIGFGDGFAFVTECLWFAGSFPLFYKYFGTTEEEKFYMWISWVIFAEGVMIDLLYLVYKKRHVDRDEEGRVATSFYGIVHLICAISGAANKLLEPQETVSEVTGAVVEMTRFLANFGYQTATVVIDVVGLLTIFSCNVASLCMSGNQVSNNGQEQQTVSI